MTARSNIQNEPWLQYLESHRDIIKPSSYSTYRRAGERHLRGLQWDKLTQEDINTLLADKELAPSTKRVIASLLKQTLEAEGSNFRVRVPPASSPDAQTLTEADAGRLINYLIADGSNVSTGILLALSAGLRIGEVCAMRWGDISLQSRTVSVQRTVQRIRSESDGKRTKLYFGEPKTRSSRRTIPLPRYLCELLEPLRSDKNHYILTGNTTVMEPRLLQYKFKRALRNANVPDINFHALRHTFATRAIDIGVDIKTLSMLLGHSDVQTTMNIYVHPSMSHMRECMEMIAGATGPEREM